MSGPRYPIYIPSKGRVKRPQTFQMLEREGIEFHAVVEPQDVDRYASWVGEDRLVVLPDDDAGLPTTRTRIKAHALQEGWERHWQIDDDIVELLRHYKGGRFRCHAGTALSDAEDFTDRYTNIALTGIRAQNFGRFISSPFQLNNNVYAVNLIRSDLPYKWRVSGIEDLDFALQVLSGGWCTVTFNVYQFSTPTTASERGGLTDLYADGGKERAALELQRRWPSLVKLQERHGEVRYHMGPRVWRRFDRPLVLKEGVDLQELSRRPHTAKLKAIGEVRAPRLRDIASEFQRTHE